MTLRIIEQMKSVLTGAEVPPEEAEENLETTVVDSFRDYLLREEVSEPVVGAILLCVFADGGFVLDWPPARIHETIVLWIDHLGESPLLVEANQALERYSLKMVSDRSEDVSDGQIRVGDEIITDNKRVFPALIAYAKSSLAEDEELRGILEGCEYPQSLYEILSKEEHSNLFRLIVTDAISSGSIEIVGKGPCNRTLEDATTNFEQMGVRYRRWKAFKYSYPIAKTVGGFNKIITSGLDPATLDLVYELVSFNSGGGSYEPSILEAYEFENVISDSFSGEKIKMLLAMNARFYDPTNWISQNSASSIKSSIIGRKRVVGILRDIGRENIASSGMTLEKFSVFFGDPNVYNHYYHGFSPLDVMLELIPGDVIVGENFDPEVLKIVFKIFSDAIGRNDNKIAVNCLEKCKGMIKVLGHQGLFDGTITAEKIKVFFNGQDRSYNNLEKYFTSIDDVGFRMFSAQQLKVFSNFSADVVSAFFAKMLIERGLSKLIPDRLNFLVKFWLKHPGVVMAIGEELLSSSKFIWSSLGVFERFISTSVFLEDTIIAFLNSGGDDLLLTNGLTDDHLSQALHLFVEEDMSAFNLLLKRIRDSGNMSGFPVSGIPEFVDTYSGGADDLIL